MPDFDYDLFVIGAGSGGVRAARMAAALGVKVAVAEDLYLGGTCVNVGCVPKKLYVYGSHFSEDFHDSAGYGWDVRGSTFDWATLRDNKKTEIERLNGIYKNLLVNSSAEIINGRASIAGPHTVLINERQVSAERILVATGSWPFIPAFDGSEYVLNSNQIFDLPELPKRLIVVGGGYIAVEFAGIFNGLGADTRLLYRRDLFLRGFDQDVRKFVAEEVTKKGVTLSFNTDVSRIEKLESGELKVYLNTGEITVADIVLYATGRQANTDGLGLEEAGVIKQKNGAIEVNEHFRTNVPSIYALGDVIGRIQLTPVALAEGMNLVRHLYQDESTVLDYNTIPTAVFCQPSIGTVGLTEEQARKQYASVDIYLSNFKPMKHTLSGNQERCLMKMIVDRETDKVLGVHMVGSEAGEIIQGIAVAMKAGATKTVFDQTIGIHPTSAEEFVTMREPVSPKNT